MELRISNRVITAPVKSVLEQLRKISHKRYLRDQVDKDDNIIVTCPFHKDGQETHPSCSVYTRSDSSKVDYGTYHCFACGAAGSLVDLVCTCTGWSTDNSEQWLIDNFSSIYLEQRQLLPEITLEKQQPNFISEDELKAYDHYHPYMWERKLSKKVVDLFQVGYDKAQNALTFPVRDDLGRLVGVTRRSVVDKRFYIPYDMEKPVYLLNYIKQWGITRVYVCESQLNALYLWTHNRPAIALFGTGSDEQYAILRRSGIREYWLAFDGDQAGRLGAKRFRQNMDKDVLVTVVHLPRGKDVNDLDIDVFLQLPTSC